MQALAVRRECILTVTQWNTRAQLQQSNGEDILALYGKSNRQRWYYTPENEKARFPIWIN